jgi:hypothetical protein
MSKEQGQRKQVAAEKKSRQIVEEEQACSKRAGRAKPTA